MQWDGIIECYLKYLDEERSLSKSSIVAYETDIAKFTGFCIERDVSLRDIKEKDVKAFMEYLESLSVSVRTEARILSGVSSFIKYLLRMGVIDNDPMILVDIPRYERKDLFILSIDEIDSLLAAVDLNNLLGYRNRAIIETLYSCGLKPTELVKLKISNLHFEEGFIEIEGKHRRLIPVCDSVEEQIRLYLNTGRKYMKIKPECEEFLFLNNRGENMSRVMILNIVNDLAKRINLKYKVCTQTLRDSFAVHLLQRGAPVEVVQKLLGHRSVLTTEMYVEAARELRGDEY